MLPLGLGFLALVTRLSLSGRAGLVIAYGYAGRFLLLASPILALGNSANAGSLIMQEGSAEVEPKMRG
jgi:hypothetical protein